MISSISQKRMNGSVALTTLIVIMAILLSAGATLIVLNVDMAKSTKDYSNVVKNDLDIESCLQESLLKLKNDPSYTGSQIMSVDGIQCNLSITVDTENANYRDVTVSTNGTDYSYDKSIIVDISTAPITIVSTN